MKVGVLLPTFRDQASDAQRVAAVAVDAGLDGLFAYDHIWPIGSPERPAVAPFPLLARLACEYGDVISLGPLVARVGLVGAEVLIGQCRALHHLAPGRVISGLGTGDRQSEPENEAYGIVTQTVDERRSQLRKVASELLADTEVWIGAGSPKTNAIARELGATLNVWNVAASEVSTSALEGPTNWAGNARDDVEVQLDELTAAGATWAIFAPGVDVRRLATWRRRHVEKG